MFKSFITINDMRRCYNAFNKSGWVSLLCTAYDLVESVGLFMPSKRTFKPALYLIGKRRARYFKSEPFHHIDEQTWGGRMRFRFQALAGYILTDSQINRKALVSMMGWTRTRF